MKTITVRVDDDLFEKIEQKRGNRSKSEFYRDAIAEYMMNTANKSEEDLNKSEHIANLERDNEALKNEMEHKDEILRLKDERIKDLQNQLGWLQAEYRRLSDRLDRFLPAPKKWWQFWKRAK